MKFALNAMRLAAILSAAGLAWAGPSRPETALAQVGGLQKAPDGARRVYERTCGLDPSFPASATAEEQIKEMDAPQ